MGFVVDFDATNNILRTVIEGHLTDAVAFALAETVSKCEASRPVGASIVDLSKVTKYDVSPDAIREFAMTSLSPSLAARTLVIVAPKEHAYGMSRMYQLLTEGTRPNQHVVRTLEEAYAVLRVTSPEFGPLNLPKTG